VCIEKSKGNSEEVKNVIDTRNKLTKKINILSMSIYTIISIYMQLILLYREERKGKRACFKRKRQRKRRVWWERQWKGRVWM